MKKFLSILCALCMTMALAVPSFAVDVTTDSVATAVSESSDTSTARAPKIPTESHKKFYFSPSGTDINVSGTISSAGDQNDKSRNAKIYLYEVGNSTAVDSYTVSQFTGSTSINTTFSNLSTNKNYYFEFRNTTSHNIFVNRWINFSLELS